MEYTDLNKVCPNDSFPLLKINQPVDAMAGHEVISFMDAYSGYNQILMHTCYQEKTSFITEQRLYNYQVMPSGLKNAGATFQWLVNKIFKDHIGNSLEVYVDDMLIKSHWREDHISHLAEAFQLLKKIR